MLISNWIAQHHAKVQKTQFDTVKIKIEKFLSHTKANLCFPVKIEKHQFSKCVFWLFATSKMNAMCAHALVFSVSKNFEIQKNIGTFIGQNDLC